MTVEISQIADLIRDMFDEYDGPVTAQTSPADVPQWDSLGHVQLLVLVEQTFKIKFTTEEIEKLKSVGDIQDAISRHLAQK